ncbi:CAAX protease family protein [Mycobacterium intracellulare]|uniref:Caax amino protease family protein n=1 Tax=Mycobacterium intracellulare (strain ATCC 13950 / DSM 43223 / JCM 6384 / NCTC 13025 / 3600) TaxID=487521 RepID=H8IQ44_MYCIA|nr:caax amino protease family protein [Mycobacterium intracellulare ATCC 13950]ETZ39419.1 CAAX protease self-immunity family protein [Mycobacterium intracellulare MIN_061107_1834]OBG03938.1 abortive phage infection protein [Mycobacterium intracellulare]BCO44972.1 CAAX protease family protein [Mycobacterium intracellulare]BCO55408.1 CAAX protease family protein [Mycobacterium intracellulare]
MAAALVGWSFAGPRLPARWRAALQAGLGGALVLVTRAPLGLGPPRLWAGLRLGSAVAFSAASTVAATTRLPPVRQSMAVREPPASAPDWLLVRIPVGTVWSEESAFRAALATAGSAAFGRRGGRVLQAIAFGLSHIPDARATGEPVAATVLVTGIGGWLFGWLADRTGSLAAPMLAHLAINEAGAIAVLAARSRGAVRG